MINWISVGFLSICLRKIFRRYISTGKVKHIKISTTTEDPTRWSLTHSAQLLFYFYVVKNYGSICIGEYYDHLKYWVYKVLFLILCSFPITLDMQKKITCDNNTKCLLLRRWYSCICAKPGDPQLPKFGRNISWFCSNSAK